MKYALFLLLIVVMVSLCTQFPDISNILPNSGSTVDSGSPDIYVKVESSVSQITAEKVSKCFLRLLTSSRTT